MSLISLFNDPLDYFRPSRLMDLALCDDDLLTSCCPRRARRGILTSPYNKHWHTAALTRDKGSNVSVDQDKFQINLDVQHFQPEEISVKATEDNTITVEGKHEERPDEHGFISRHFVRKYTLPRGHDIEKVKSKLSSDGVLTIIAPKENPHCDERSINIEFTGKPSIQAIQDNCSNQTKDNIVCNGEMEESPRPRRK